jgi:hypothetical protein
LFDANALVHLERLSALPLLPRGVMSLNARVVQFVAQIHHSWSMVDDFSG